MFPVIAAAAGAVFGGGAMGGGMAGLLGSIAGPLLGGILGGGKKDASPDFGKTLEGFAPANVLNALANLTGNIMGSASQNAMNTLHREDGMPAFIRDEVNRAVGNAVQDAKRCCDPKAQDAVDDAAGKGTMKEIERLTQELLDQIRELLEKRTNEDTNEACSASGEGKSKKKVGAQSWLAAIAEALGKVMGAKAGELVRLSEEVSNVADKQMALADEMKGASEDDKEDLNAEKEKLAAEMTQKQTELQGAGQEYKLIAETTATALKSIGEALSSVARKQ